MFVKCESSKETSLLYFILFNQLQRKTGKKDLSENVVI